MRSTESTALHILRAIEEEGIQRKASEAAFYMASPVALYILNQKRSVLADIEARYQFKVFLESDDSLMPPEFRVERRQSQSDEVRREVHPHQQISPDDETRHLSAPQAIFRPHRFHDTGGARFFFRTQTQPWQPRWQRVHACHHTGRQC